MKNKPKLAIYFDPILPDNYVEYILGNLGSKYIANFGLFFIKDDIYNT